MRDILEWSEHFFDWTGRRVDLLNNILSLEKGDPERFLMYSKKFKKYLPVSMRRIQDFINKGIIPPAEIEDKSYRYNAEHLGRYLAAIILKNQGYTLSLIQQKLKDMSLDEILKRVLRPEGSENYISNINKSDLTEKLKRLGRNEGKVLRTQWLKFAITKWCHLDIKKKELKNLNPEDINTLTLALKETLLETSKVKNIDKVIG